MQGNFYSITCYAVNSLFNKVKAEANLVLNDKCVLSLLTINSIIYTVFMVSETEAPLSILYTYIDVLYILQELLSYKSLPNRKENSYRNDC